MPARLAPDVHTPELAEPRQVSVATDTPVLLRAVRGGRAGEVRSRARAGSRPQVVVPRARLLRLAL